MSDEIRDPFKPVSAEEIEQFRTVIFPSLPTFREEDWSIGTADIAGMFNALKWERSAEQVAAYAEYWDKGFEGRIPFDLAQGILEQCHVAGPYLREMIKNCDKNGDGFISKEEFQLFFDICEKHHVGKTFSYDKFLVEADINHDGRVSIDEAVAWAEKQAESL